MAILMISYNRDKLVSVSGPDGYVMFSASEENVPQIVFSVKVLVNDRVEELGVAFLNPDNSLDFRAGYTDWEK